MWQRLAEGSSRGGASAVLRHLLQPLIRTTSLPELCRSPAAFKRFIEEFRGRLLGF